MTTPDPGAPELFRAIGLQPDGPGVVGRPIRASGPGVYVVELAAPLGSAPLDINRIGKWVERLPALKLDGRRPTSKALAARLASFWLPSRRVLFVGSANTSIGGRIAALDRHILGDRAPHASSHWLKTLHIDVLRVWWAESTATEEVEDALLTAFAASVPPAEVAALPDASVVLPWANQRTVTGESKQHGITGSIAPAPPSTPTPPGHVVDLPPGDADGARVPTRGTGATRKASPSAPRRATATPRKAPAGRPASDKSRPAEAVLLSAEGLEKLQAEHEQLVGRRPEIVGRIRIAKELGDLKENSDYTSAREEQSFLEGRIQSIEAQMRAAVVVQTPETGDRVTVGSVVKVEVEGDERTFTIVGTSESDPSSGRISYQSPVGRALVGRSAGEEAVATTPGGELRLRIVAIS